MRVIFNGNGFTFSISWKSIRAALGQLQPLVIAIGAFLAAPEVRNIISLVIDLFTR